MPRSISLRLLAVLGLTLACDLSEQLEGEPCTVDGDCWHTQECARTIDEEWAELPGVCQPEGTGCVLGQQLGCPCEPLDPLANCTVIALPVELYATYPKMTCHETLRLCAPAPAEEGPPP